MNFEEMTEHSGKAFDFEADYGRQYDQFIRQIIPGYDAYFEICLALLSEGLDENPRLLVAGCGTGAELTCFARNRPRWKWTGVDLSKQMLDLCRKKLDDLALETGFRPDTEIVEGDVTRLDRPGEFDAVACNLVLHFIPGYAKKLEFLAALRGQLKPGGILILMDACWEKDHAFQKWMRAWWGFAKSRGLKSEKWQSFREDFEKGLHPLTKNDQEKLLLEAGFGEIFPFWSSLHHLALVARKP